MEEEYRELRWNQGPGRAAISSKMNCQSAWMRTRRDRSHLFDDTIYGIH